MDLEEAQGMAVFLIREHGLEAEGWTFAWGRGTREFGACWRDTRQIRLSRRLTLVNPRDEVRDTVLHEIAHAKVGRLAPKHGAEWRMAARALGARPEARYGDHQVIAVTPRWICQCSTCHSTGTRHRRTRNAICGVCGTPIDWEENPEWTT